jgi:hypothetical protein
MQDATPTTTKQYQCRHIFTDGRRCASPCLRQEEFCYYHHTTRRPVADPRQRRSRRSTFDLAFPEDRSAIQSSIGEVLRRIASNEIDTKRAGLLLYGLQIASINLPRAAPPSRDTKPRLYSYGEPNEDSSETTLVKEFVIDPKLGALAPRAEIVPEERKLTVIGQLLKDLHRNREEAVPTAEPEPQVPAAPPAAPPAQIESPAEATILPSLQATATLLPLAVLLALQIRTVSSPRHPEKKNRHLDRSRAVSSHDAVERPPHFSNSRLSPDDSGRSPSGESRD